MHWLCVCTKRNAEQLFIKHISLFVAWTQFLFHICFTRVCTDLKHSHAASKICSVFDLNTPNQRTVTLRNQHTQQRKSKLLKTDAVEWKSHRQVRVDIVCSSVIKFIISFSLFATSTSLHSKASTLTASCLMSSVSLLLVMATVPSVHTVHQCIETAQFHSILCTHLKFNTCIFPWF